MLSIRILGYRKTSGYPSKDVYQKIRWRVAREIMKVQEAMKASR